MVGRFPVLSHGSRSTRLETRKPASVVAGRPANGELEDPDTGLPNAKNPRAIKTATKAVEDFLHGALAASKASEAKPFVSSVITSAPQLHLAREWAAVFEHMLDRVGEMRDAHTLNSYRDWAPRAMDFGRAVRLVRPVGTVQDVRPVGLRVRSLTRACALLRRVPRVQCARGVARRGTTGFCIHVFTRRQILSSQRCTVRS